MIIAAIFAGASLSLSLLVLIMGTGWERAKRSNQGIVLQFPKRGRFVDEVA